MKFIWDELVWVLPAFLAIFCYITGDLATLLLKVNKGICLKVLSGFVLLLCIFHLLSLPFMYNDWPFTSLYNLFLCSLVVILLLYAIVSLKRRRIPLQDDFERLRIAFWDIAKNRKWHFLVWGIVLFLIVWQVAMVIRHVSFNVDDNFYVSESLTILSRNRLMNVLPASGIEGSIFPATYQLVSWEVWIAALSKLFCTTPAVLCHSILPAFLIPLSYASCYMAVREFSLRKAALALLFVALLHIAAGPVTYNQGAFLILRIWQGKAVLANIMFPLLLSVFLRMVKTRTASKHTLYFLFVLLLAGQAMTTVGVYLVPVLYAVYAVAFLIITHRWKAFFRLFLPAAAIAPFVLWKLWVLLSAGTLGELSEGAGVYDRSFREISLRYFGFSIIIVFFIAALVILAVRLKKGPTKPLRFFFVLSTVLLVLCFLNPFVMPYVEQYITGVGVYWRIFWLLQITPVTAIGFAYFADLPKQRLLRTALICFLSFAVLISGRSIFEDEDVKESFKNHSKISETTRRIAYTVRSEITRDHPNASEEELQTLEQEAIVLLPRNLSTELRQYADISLIYYPYNSNNYYAYQTDEEYKLLSRIYDRIYRKKTWEKAELSEAMQELGIDYVAIGTPTAQKNTWLMPDEFEKVYEGSRYILYKTNGGE